MSLRRPIPDQSVLRSLLDYCPETGELSWRERPLSMFSPTERFSAEWSWKKWNTRYAGQKAFARIDDQGYHAGTLFHTKHRAHRIIWKWMTGEDAYLVDHINGDRRDNRWANLRETDDVGNARNAAIPRTNKSGCVGVRFNCQQRRWIAYIKQGGSRHVHLGTFRSRDEAIHARALAQAELGYHPNHGRKAVAR